VADWEKQRTSFGAVAGTYDSYRPEWPAATAAWLTGTQSEGPPGPLTGRAPLDVLDLGAGTGKLTRTLVRAGHRVTAVDPSEGMLAVLSQTLPGVTTVLAPAEQLPLADNSFDVVTVAQAWHWFDHAVTGAECARVLRPGGLLSVAWHLRTAAEDWVKELDVIAGEPEYQSREAVQSRSESLELPDAFGRLQTTTFDYGLRLTPEGLAALTSSWSYVIVRPDREQVLAHVTALGRRVADADGMLTLPFVTYCYRAPLLDRPS
jgi:ubiquinone/menaquinone biosynthesis C-methylase UbiE